MLSRCTHYLKIPFCLNCCRYSKKLITGFEIFLKKLFLLKYFVVRLSKMENVVFDRFPAVTIQKGSNINLDEGPYLASRKGRMQVDITGRLRHLEFMGTGVCK